MAMTFTAEGLEEILNWFFLWTRNMTLIQPEDLMQRLVAPRKAVEMVREEFSPHNLGERMHRQFVNWSEANGNQGAYLHVFRRTGLPFALSGEQAKQEVAKDARIIASVMAARFAQGFIEELWHNSNRTFRCILSSIPVVVAALYGYEEEPTDG